MSMNINTNDLTTFIKQRLGLGNEVDRNEAKVLGAESEFNRMAEDKDVINVDDIVADLDGDLYTKFATLYVQEQEKTDAKEDEEKEKENADKQRTTSGNGGKA